MKFISILIILIIISISISYFYKKNTIQEGMLKMKKTWFKLRDATPEECQNLAINQNNRFIRTIKNLDEEGKCWGSGAGIVNAITTNKEPDKYSMWINRKYNWNGNEIQLKWCGSKNNNCASPDQCLTQYSENSDWYKLTGSKEKIKFNSCKSSNSGSNKNMLWWKIQKIGNRNGVPENYIKMDYVKSGGQNKNKCISGEGKGLTNCGSNKTKIRLVPWNNIKINDKISYKKDGKTGYALVKEVKLNNDILVVCPINSITDAKCRGEKFNLKEDEILNVVNYNKPITSSLRDVVQLKNAEGKCLGLVGASPGWKSCMDPSTRFKPQAIGYKSFISPEVQRTFKKWYNRGNHLVHTGNLNGMFVDNLRFETLAYDQGWGNTSARIRIKCYNKKGKEILHKAFYPGRQKKVYKRWISWHHRYCSRYSRRRRWYRQYYWRWYRYRQRYYRGRSCNWRWWRGWRCWSRYGYRWRWYRRRTYRNRYYWQRYCSRRSSHPHYGGAWKVVGNTYRDNKAKNNVDLSDEDRRVHTYKVFVHPPYGGNRIYMNYFKLKFFGYQ